MTMIDSIRSSLRAWLRTFQLSDGIVTLLEAVTSLFVIVILAAATYLLVREIVRRFLPVITKHLNSKVPDRWIDALQQRLVAGRSAHIVAALLLYQLLPYALVAYPQALTVIRNVIEAYVVLASIIAVNALLSAAGDVFVSEDETQQMRSHILTQAAQTVVAAVGGVLMLSVLFDTSVTVLLSSLAGMAAIIVLLFRDSILGFVAGYQLSNNDMLNIGDWIEVPQYGADGTVRDVRLTTVKVQNFDNTISTIPTYALVSESFKNWRGMKESGARRIKRAIPIDLESIKCFSDEEIERMKKIDLLQSYLKHQLAEVTAYNDQLPPDRREPPNTRALTNIGTFRVYLEKYLESHPAISGEMLVLVRQLAPGPQGLPIEIYAFLKQQEWVEYERIQSSIFDHIISVLPVFGLRALQLSDDLRG